MIPLVGDGAASCSRCAPSSSRSPPRCSTREGVELTHLEWGTMIELPRAAVTAGEIAERADFFSFGTNDLTQTAFGFSRDDIGKFVAMYEERKLVPANPFVTIDRAGRRAPDADRVRGGPGGEPDAPPRHLRRARRRPGQRRCSATSSGWTT